MSNIIKFPGKCIKSKAKSMPFIAEKIDIDSNLPINELDFTCPTCYSKLRFKFEHVVFKNIQFFCSACGTGWKVSNPIFSNKTNAQNKAT
jgi:hypothetical protein